MYKKFIIVLIFLLLPFAYNTNIFTNKISIDERYTQFLPERYLTAEILKNFEIPLWNPYDLAGSPHLAKHYPGVLYPPNLLFYLLLPPALAFNLLEMLHYTLAGLFTYLYLRKLNVHSIGAVYGGILYMFSGFMIGHIVHTPMVQSAAWLPVILYLIEKLKEKCNFKYAVFISLALSIQFFAGYMQTSMYTYIIVIFYILFIAFSNTAYNKNRLLIYGITAIVFSILINAIQILPTLEMVPYTVRDKLTYEDFTAFSLPFSMLPIMIFPKLWGATFPGFYKISYFGPWNLAEVGGYVGLIPILLAFAALSNLKNDNQKKYILFWAIVGAAAFSFVFGQENPFYKIMFYVPVYNMFRCPARWFMIVNFAISVLAGLGISKLLYLKSENHSKYTSKVKYIVYALILTIVLSSILISTFHYSANLLKDSNGNYQTLIKNLTLENPAIYIQLLMFFIAAGLFLFSLSKRTSLPIIFCLLIILLVIDLHFYRKDTLIEEVDTDVLFSKKNTLATAAYLYANERNNYFRVYPIFINYYEGTQQTMCPNINETLGIQSIAGYGPLVPSRFLQIVLMVNVGVSMKYLELIKDNRILSLLNVKYLMTLTYKSYRDLINYIQSYPYYEKVLEKDGAIIFKNKNVYPKAFLVSKIQPIKNIEEAVTIFWYGNTPFDPRTTALVEGLDEKADYNLSNGTAAITKYTTTSIEMSVETKGKSFLVVSENYFPGWKAFIDGKKTPIYITDGMLQGVFIPAAGIHSVKLVYLPLSFIYGAVISLLSFLALFIVWLILAKKENG